MAQQTKKKNKTLDASLGQFDSAVLKELKNLLKKPVPDDELKAAVELIIDKELKATEYNKLYKLFYQEMQKKIIAKTDIIKELLKYRVSKTPKTVDAIHIYLHPDVLGDYNSEDWIKQQQKEDYSVNRVESGVQQQGEETSTDPEEISSQQGEI